MPPRPSLSTPANIASRAVRGWHRRAFPALFVPQIRTGWIGADQAQRRNSQARLEGDRASDAPGGQGKHRGALRRGAAAAIAAMALIDTAIAADLPSKEQPVLLSADEVSYDRDLGVVTARGHVELSQGNRILLADTVSYNERSGTVAASGNVSLLE